RPARSQDYFHLASGSFARIKLNDGLPRRFTGKVLWRLLGNEVSDANAPAAAGSTLGRGFAGLGDAGHAQTGQWLNIRGVSSVGANYQDLAYLVKAASTNLNDAR